MQRDSGKGLNSVCVHAKTGAKNIPAIACTETCVIDYLMGSEEIGVTTRDQLLSRRGGCLPVGGGDECCGWGGRTFQWRAPA